ncbi:unnamed protein product [Durusdinium trenchii]|uniref:Uncharacterized protein n=1 Tax=Durusdinium trenchii TaxID=1381693 RepID=A0ABP0HJ43_9DINO
MPCCGCSAWLVPTSAHGPAGEAKATASSLPAESVLVSATTPSFQMPLERLGGKPAGVWRLEAWKAGF